MQGICFHRAQCKIPGVQVKLQFLFAGNGQEIQIPDIVFQVSDPFGTDTRTDTVVPVIFHPNDRSGGDIQARHKQFFKKHAVSND